MRILVPVILILIAILTIGLAGDWIVDNVSISNQLSQTTTTATNTIMGALGVGTTTPEAKLHVVGTAKIAGTLDLSGNRVINLSSPTNATDAVTKAYLDTALQDVQPVGVSMGIYTNR